MLELPRMSVGRREIEALKDHDLRDLSYQKFPQEVAAGPSHV